MSDFLLDPPRWKDRCDQTNAAERSAGQAIRSLDQPRPLSADQLARIVAKVRPFSVRRSSRRFWLTVTAALLLGGATASAARLDVLPHWLVGVFHRETRTPEPLAPLARGQHHKPRTALAETAETPTDSPPPAPPIPITAEPSTLTPGPPAPDPTEVQRRSDVVAPDRQPMGARRPATDQTATNRAATGRTTVPARRAERPADLPTLPAPRPVELAEMARPEPSPAAPMLEPTTSQGSLAWRDGPRPTRSVQPSLPASAMPTGAPRPSPTERRESAAKQLSEAIRALRVEHAPDAALSLLDRYGEVLDRSGLSHEVLIVRVEALLQLRREDEALRLLDVTALSDVAAQRPLLITRGELRAARGRCDEAIGDFDLVLATSSPPDPRAQRGRAACLQGSSRQDSQRR